MSNNDEKDVEKVFGTVFKQYCKNRGIIPKKVKGGAFEVPKLSVLHDYEEFLRLHRSDMILELKELQDQVFTNSALNRYIEREDYILEDKNHAQTTATGTSKMGQNKKQKESNISVKLKSTCAIVPTKVPRHVCTKNILNEYKSGIEIFNAIMNNNLHKYRLSYRVLNEYLFPLLENFRRYHIKFKYHMVLRNSMEKSLGGSTEKLSEFVKGRDVCAMNSDEVETFLIYVFRRVVPKNLFGSVKNKRRIIFGTFQYVKVSCNKPFDLSNIIRKLNKKSITWLNCTQHETVQNTLITQFVKWFFGSFIASVLHGHLIIKSHPIPLMIRRWDWYELEQKFLTKWKRKQLLENISSPTGWQPSEGYYKLVPKIKYSEEASRNIIISTRPVVVAKKQREDQVLIPIIQNFLLQLLIRNFECKDFRYRWQPIVENLNRSSAYVVATDIRHAFGSIKLRKLYDMILTLCDDLPDCLPVKYISTERYRKLNNYVMVKPIIVNDDLPVPLAPGKLFSRFIQMPLTSVRKSWLLNRIRKYIFCQRILIGKKTYTVGHGIAQGTRLSSIFSDTYYAYILNQMTQNIKDAGSLVTYVDDILYVTGSEQAAMRFYALICKEGQQYGCVFKRNKTWTNLPTANPERYATMINFLGCYIDTKTLEVKPNFPKNGHFSLPVQRPSVNKYKYLTRQMSNLHCLQTHKLLLDGRVNSKNTIIETVTKFFECQKQTILKLFKANLFRQFDLRNVRMIKKIIINSKRNIRCIVYKILSVLRRVPIQTAMEWIEIIENIFYNVFKDIIKCNSR